MAWPVSGNSPVIEGPPWYNHPRNNIFIESKDHKNIELSMICAFTATSFEQDFYHKHKPYMGPDCTMRISFIDSYRLYFM